MPWQCLEVLIDGLPIVGDCFPMGDGGLSIKHDDDMDFTHHNGPNNEDNCS